MTTGIWFLIAVLTLALFAALFAWLKTLKRAEKAEKLGGFWRRVFIDDALFPEHPSCRCAPIEPVAKQRPLIDLDEYFDIVDANGYVYTVNGHQVYSHCHNTITIVTSRLCMADYFTIHVTDDDWQKLLPRLNDIEYAQRMERMSKEEAEYRAQNKEAECADTLAEEEAISNDFPREARLTCIQAFTYLLKQPIREAMGLPSPLAKEADIFSKYRDELGHLEEKARREREEHHDDTID